MKLKATIYSIFIVLAFVACEDDLSSVGIGIQPDSDKINVRTDTISFTSSTQVMDSIYINTSTAYLGSFDDPTYGNIRYSYLCNFYSIPDSVFKSDVIDNKIDSVVLSLLYSSFVGDSLTPMQATVREVTKPLDKNFYSNINPLNYVDMNSPAWAKTTYTARNMNVSDSAYTAGDHTVKFKLPNSVGEKFYNEWKTNGNAKFADLDEFFKFFPGVSIESTYGSGNILNIYRTILQVYYDTHVQLKKKDGSDSTVVVRPDYAIFYSTEEVTQLNRIDSREGDAKMLNDKEHTYLKTPAGVITQLEIPLDSIVKKVGDDRFFNNVRLALTAEDQATWDYTLKLPPTLLLISKDSVKPFFEEGRTVVNSSYSYVATKANSSAYKYDFGNISNLVQNSIKKWNEQYSSQELWPPLKLWVIPVQILTDGYGNPYRTNNYFEPSGAKLRIGTENLKLYITTTKTNK